MKAYKVEIIAEHLSDGGWEDHFYSVKIKYFSTKEKAEYFRQKEIDYYGDFNKEHYNEETELGDRYLTSISTIEIEE